MRPPRETGTVEIRFGRGLRALRIRRAWRQSDVGAAAGLSRSLVSKVEGGDIDGIEAFTDPEQEDADDDESDEN